jgi:SHAQKYF class myb-like DNA-binding protein
MEPDDYDYDSTPPSNPSHPTKHTQFLDLTNGEGGDGEKLRSLYDGDDEYPDHSDITSTRRGTALSAVSSGIGGSGEPSLSLTGSGGQMIDPSTPGRVVDTGSEHTGRWTKEEHEAFLSALKLYGKEWKKVAAKVKTRTVVQTRTHAQKYFQKLAKSTDGSGDEVSSVDMGVASDSGGKKSGSSQKKKQRQIPPAQKVQRTASVSNAAQVISNLSGYAVSAAVAQPIAETSPTSSTASSKARGFQFGIPGEGGGFRLASGGSPTSSLEPGLLQHPTHGFSSTFPSSSELPTAEFKSSLAASLERISSAAETCKAEESSTFFQPHGGAPAVSSSFPSMMKIVAPEPDSAMKRGKFPEPSPAACGKRKLAEIAAARMLAGVLASEPQTKTHPPTMTIGHSTLATDQDMHYQENFEDGTATPPPEAEKAPETGAAIRMMAMSVPHLTAFSDSAPKTTISEPDVAPPKKTFGLSLQIVNPESLGVSHEQIEKRRKEGQGSPVTPWEGQLQALVR